MRMCCNSVYFFHISPFIYHCQALFCSNTSVWCCCMSFLTIFCRNAILIILNSFSSNASFVKFRFLTSRIFCWIALHTLKSFFFLFRVSKTICQYSKARLFFLRRLNTLKMSLRLKFHSAYTTVAPNISSPFMRFNTTF